MLGYLVDPNKQFVTKDGAPMTAGHVEVFLVDTDDHAVTYHDFDGTLNPADIAIDSNGRAVVIADDAVSYRVEVYDASGALQWTVSPAIVGDGGGSVDISGCVRADVEQDFSDAQKSLARENIGAVGPSEISGFVSATAPQSWTDGQKEQGRYNIGASQGKIDGADWPLGSPDLMTLDADIYSKTLLLEYASNPSKHIGCSLPPLLDPSDYGKIPFSTAIDDAREGEPGVWQKFVMRNILENCADSDAVKLALKRGQVPIVKTEYARLIPSYIDDTGYLVFDTRFGVSDNNPMTGDALGKALMRQKGDGAIYNSCTWGKPYGLNYIEVAECKCNNNYHLGLGDETIMAWRRIPMDKDIVITAFSLIGKTATVKKAMMVGIFEVEGDSVTNVSASSTWTEDSGYYYNDMENAVRLQDIITSGSGTRPFVTFSLSEPLTLHAGKNYLFPCRFNDDNTYNDPWVYTYKRAVPAMPWEELVQNDTENGNPVMSTALPCCKPSALYVRLANGTEMWI